MTGVSATTDTTSVNWPIASVNGKRFALPTWTLMFVCSAVEKPSSSTFRLYVPGGTAGNTYKPDSFVWVRRMALVAALVSVTRTPGMTDPLESTTVPLISPDGVCAVAGSARTPSRRIPSSNRLHMHTPPSKRLRKRTNLDVPERNRKLLVLQPDVTVGKFRVTRIERRLAVQHDYQVIAVSGDLKMVPLVRFERKIARGLCRPDNGAGVVASRLLPPDLHFVPAGFLWGPDKHPAVRIL